jgi:hypothetical protein
MGFGATHRIGLTPLEAHPNLPTAFSLGWSTRSAPGAQSQPSTLYETPL